MTARYRCCWCGSAVSSSAKTMREHIITKHRMALELALRPIESFDTRNPPRRPPEALKPHPRTNAGVSGEGDS